MNLAGMCLVKEEAIVSLEMRHEYQRILKVCLFECRAKIIQKVIQLHVPTVPTCKKYLPPVFLLTYCSLRALYSTN